MEGHATDTLRPWQGSAIGDRRSVAGAIAIALVVVLYVAAIPILNDSVEATLETDEAGRYVVDDYTTMLLPDGWTIESQSDFLTTLTDGSYLLVVIVSSPDEVTSAHEALQPAHEGYGADPANEVTPIVTFGTDAGGDAAGYRFFVVADPSGNGAASFAVVQSGRSFKPSFTGPADLTDPFYDEAEAIVRTVEISVEPKGGS